ncbi:hypothetical protein [Halobellus rufus]|uniref:hypothetical protein n=1 Tax=Halobellus rufus TaxID=1448860 RepID=UPI0006786554|nr:hypothetical protein [Halobellus rufus]
MGDTDDRLLNASKLFEQARGRMDNEAGLLPHAGLPLTEADHSVLSFLYDDPISEEMDAFEETQLGQVVDAHLRSESATRAIKQGDGAAMSYLVGITEQDLDASALTLPAQILGELDRDGALTTVLAAGDPNTGKTNSAWLLVELGQILWDDLLVLSNARAGIVDERVTTCHDLALSLLEHRDVPKAVVIDEGSTHFDARTNSRDVATQWSPLLKRMSKLGVELVIVIGHTGKDVDPEMKRLTSLAFYKTEPKTIKFYREWPADSDRPTDQLFGGSVESLEATSVQYDPDEPAPWSWNLRSNLFDLDLSWPALLAELRDRGPTE